MVNGHRSILVWKWIEAYSRCKIKNGEEISRYQIFLILKDHYRSGPVPISQMASCIYTKMPWFVKIGDGLYRNTLGDHYGEPFPKRVVINGKIEYVFDSAVKNPRRKGTLN